MALKDHFRPPLSVRRHWHAFHNAWATYLAADLNRHLPEGYFAEPNVQFGIEIDVATFEEVSAANIHSGWSSPAPTQTVPISILTDLAEVLVYNQDAGAILAAAIELVSPANKDRPAHRDAFVSKCAAYLQQGVGLAVVDVVTDRHANLHEDLLTRLQAPVQVPFAAELYVVSYRPKTHEGEPNLDIWQEPLAVGGPLPEMPLWLSGGLCFPLDLDGTYERTCREHRIV